MYFKGAVAVVQIAAAGLVAVSARCNPSAGIEEDALEARELCCRGSCRGSARLTAWAQSLRLLQESNGNTIWRQSLLLAREHLRPLCVIR